MSLFRRSLRRLLQTSIKKKMVFLIVGLITITPTLLIALLASAYYYLGIESLFNEKISTALSETVQVAELYLQEHNETIKVDIMGIAKDIERNSSLLSESPSNFDDLWAKEEELRSISEAMIFTKNNQIISKTLTSLSFYFEKIPPEVLAKADKGEVVVLDSGQGDKVRAVMRLFYFDDAYLLIGRDVDQKILNYLESTQGSQAQYQSLLTDIGKTRTKLGLAFIALSIILCITAIVIALSIAKRIARPINQLVLATAQIKHGDFSIRVPEAPGRDEIAILARAFNQMTQHIADQTNKLKQVNAIVDQRRRFIEAVLKEISSGLLVIDTNQNISLCNQAAYSLLHKSENSIIGKNYSKVISEIGDLLEKAKQNPGVVVSDNIAIYRRHKDMQLFVRVGTEVNSLMDITSYIVTMDDMTTLIAAQRAAAWSEVARRIAHEIKNPLTPINLAADRLSHKFSKQITSDQDLFHRYINTITQHVEDIGNIVEDFIRFAKIPAPNMQSHDICKIIDGVVFSHKTVAPYITFTIDSKVSICKVLCDKTQISQVMINLIKNAIESIDFRIKQDGDNVAGEIKVKLSPTVDNNFKLQIIDNGIGIPEQLLTSIHDPYVTTKPNGTGLGLAIVKKIIEDHGGTIEITNNKKHGVTVAISIPASK